jgi:hypothetical protein
LEPLQESIDKAESAFQEKDYNSALKYLIKVLDISPENNIAHDLTMNIIYLGMGSGSPFPISKGLLSDPILDPFFAECANCQRFWAVNPFFKKAASLTVLNPVGGICVQCNKVLCRNCIKSINGIITCPDCGKRVSPLKIPNGRTRNVNIQSSKNKPCAVLLFKSQPAPPVMKSYFQMVLEVLCPEALLSETDLYAETTPDKIDQTYALIKTMSIRPDLNSSTHNFVTERFTDKDGGNGILMKIYDK